MGDALKLIIIIIIKKKTNPGTIRLESILIKFPSWEIVENRGKKMRAMKDKIC